jgi:hypothetical protein
MFDANKGIVRLTHADQLVEFDLDRGTIAVLGVLTSRMR